MTWKIHDEFIDLSRARHVIVFRNEEIKAEHHLVHEFNIQACPHCGTPTESAAEPVDLQQKKADTLVALNAHHKTLMQYRAKHSFVRLDTHPK